MIVLRQALEHGRYKCRGGLNGSGGINVVYRLLNMDLLETLEHEYDGPWAITDRGKALLRLIDETYGTMSTPVLQALEERIKSDIKNDPSNCGLCGRDLADADTCSPNFGIFDSNRCPYKPMTMPQRLAHRATSIRITQEIAAEQALREPVDPRSDVQIQLDAFEKAYWTAAISSLPEDWIEAAQIGKQLANALKEERS